MVDGYKSHEAQEEGDDEVEVGDLEEVEDYPREQEVQEGDLYRPEHDVFDLEEHLGYLIGLALADVDEPAEEIHESVEVVVLDDVVGGAEEDHGLEEADEDEVDDPVDTGEGEPHDAEDYHEHLLHERIDVLERLVVILDVDVAETGLDGFGDDAEDVVLVEVVDAAVHQQGRLHVVLLLGQEVADRLRDVELDDEVGDPLEVAGVVHEVLLDEVLGDAVFDVHHVLVDQDHREDDCEDDHPEDQHDEEHTQELREVLLEVGLVEELLEQGEHQPEQRLDDGLEDLVRDAHEVLPHKDHEQDHQPDDLLDQVKHKHQNGDHQDLPQDTQHRLGLRQLLRLSPAPSQDLVRLQRREPFHVFPFILVRFGVFFGSLLDFVCIQTLGSLDFSIILLLLLFLLLIHQQSLLLRLIVSLWLRSPLRVEDEALAELLVQRLVDAILPINTVDDLQQFDDEGILDGLERGTHQD